MSDESNLKRATVVAAVLVAVLALALCAADFPADVEPPAKLPIPPQAEQQKRLDVLNEIYGADKTGTDKDKVKVVGELLKMIPDTKGKPTDRFVLLRKSMELASEAGDAVLMIEVIDRIGAEFQFDAITTKGKMLRAAAANATTPERIASLVEASNTYIDDAIEQKRFDYAEHIAGLVSRATQRARAGSLHKQMAERTREIQKLHAEYKKLATALAAAQANPDDRAANLAVGRLYCFARGEWDRGLEYLARGSDPALAALATDELNKPADWSAQAEIGHGWWDLAQDKSGKEKETLLLRAGLWYEKAQDGGAVGLAKLKMEKRLEEIAKIDRADTVSGQVKTFFLDDMLETSAVVYKTLGKHGATSGSSKGRVNGKEFQHALSAHPPKHASSSVVTYDLGGRFISLDTVAALWDSGHPKGPLIFKVIGDGKLLWQSTPMQKGGQTQICKVGLKGVKTLKLEVNCPGNYQHAHAVWVNPQVVGREEPVPKSAKGLKPGLLAEIYEGMNFEKKLTTQVYRMVNVTWGRGDSPTPRPTKRPFSIRFSGWLLAPRPGNYRLKVFSDDGVRLWLDGRLLVDAWIPQTGREGHDAQVTLTGRPHQLKIEYFDKGTNAKLHFLWSQGAAEPTPVPPQALFHSK